jgi:endonuclease G
MAIQDALQTFRQLVTDTQDARALVRKKVAYGRWRDADPDPVRRDAFFAGRRDLNLPLGAEAMQGPTSDYQSVVFLPSGADVRRCVGYVEVNDPRSPQVATGFLVGPSLFLTNRHVLADAAAAKSATVTFDRENDARRVPRATTTFRFDPDRFAIFSPEEELDMALVALGPRVSGVADLSGIPYARLSDRPDKHVVGMNVNIIEHPLGWPKTIAIRNNLLTYRTDRTLLYETDTEVGSSGSPVFNDDWEVVALHHWGHPFLEREDDQGQKLPDDVNEGIRISAITKYLLGKMPGLPPEWQALLRTAIDSSDGPVDGGRTLSSPRPGAGEEALINRVSTGVEAMNDARSEFTFAVPLSITVRLGAGAPALVQGVVDTSAMPAKAPDKTLKRGSEALKIDEDYASRRGYRSDFIPGFALPLPEPTAKLANKIAALRPEEPNAENGELKYEHFSLKMHKSKRMAIFTATNIDGKTYLTVDRGTGQVVDGPEGDKWFNDPRIPGSVYLDQSFYGDWSDYFDRGHLTRRTDPTWGTPEEAERANADTFHFTNCSPQHFRFNESAKYWQGLERFVLENGLLADDNRKPICVFQGPVFDANLDHWADNVQIPSSFWKVVVWKGADKLKAVGLVVDQLPLLGEKRKSLGKPQELPSVDVTHWRVAIKTIEKRTGLDFGADIRDADTIAGQGQPRVGEEAAPFPVRAWKDLL